MGVIAKQTIKTLEQYDPSEKVEILDWTTRLTFETIGRCGFGYEFGLLDSRDAPPHPFIDAMGYCLNHAVERTRQLGFIKHLPLERNRQFDRSVKLMNDIVDQVIKERKNGPEAGDKDKDLLGFMLNARDEHDLGLSDENIRYQVVTFLIAGHDVSNHRIWKRSIVYNFYICIHIDNSQHTGMGIVRAITESQSRSKGLTRDRQCRHHP